MKTMLSLLLFISGLFNLQAYASTSSACVTLNGSLASSKANLNHVGSAKLKVWFWNVYTSDLYTPTGMYTGNEQCLLFEINYLMDISKEDLINRTVENWQHLGLRKSSYHDFIPRLKSIWPNVSEGDQLALKVIPSESEFYLNGKSIGKIEDKHFAAIFLSIWLSEKTTQPQLRKQLLGAI